MQYDPNDYQRPSITADILVFTVDQGHMQLLLIRREEAPFQGCWAIPGGFIAMTETAEDAARRCLFEETGLSNLYLEQLYTFTGVKRDPRMRIISVAYIGLTPPAALENVKSGARTSDARLFTVERQDGDLRLWCESGGFGLPEADVAFDHADMIRLAVDRMRGKLEYTDIAFAFLRDPAAFTLSQLQSVYEAIAGKKYDTPNFRRFVKSRYESTGHIVNTGRRSAGSGKSAALYARVNTDSNN